MANPQLSLRSGMFARASLVLSERKGAVLVPEEAVTPIGADLFVWVAEDGKARRVKVEPGLRTEGLAEVRGDLKPGDLVVTAGQQRLMRDGQEVKVQGTGGPPAAKGGSSGPQGDKGAPRSPPGAPPEGKGPPGGAREGAAGK
jgi:membrane fusion protein (multidrug efflux system)